MAEPASTPWWSNLLAVLITAIISVVGTLYAMRPSAPGAPLTTSIGSFFKDTITYIPHILILFGILADMLTYEGVYSIPSLIGLLSIPANWAMKYFWVGIAEVFGKAWEVLNWKNAPAIVAAPVAAVAAAVETTPPVADVPNLTGGAAGDFFKDYDGCTVQGFGWAKSPYAPQTLVLTATILSYYMIDLIQNRGWTSATATIVLFGVFYAAQVMVVGSSCVEGPSEPGTFAKAVASLSEGLLFGGTSYALVQAYAPERLPSSVLSVYPRKTAKDLKPGANGTMVDEEGNPYVCLPGGQCIPDVSTMEARKNFATSVSKTLGTGRPPVVPNCPAK